MQKKCILVIEDDASVRQGIVDALELEGFRVCEADRGDRGLNAAVCSGCNLVLLDLILPGMDGLDVLVNIRKTCPSLPVIILTGQTTEDDRIKGLNLGADDYVVKPFSIGELLARVEAVLRRSPERRPDISFLKIPNGKIYLERREVHFDDGNVLKLAERECSLLKYLATNANRIISREEIFLRVWGLNARKVTTRTIDMHVSKLRDKLLYSKDAPNIISTVRGKGYMYASAHITNDEDNNSE